ncbi:hypothetical protein GCM10027589_53610 [Actinocorallia lasiicapitis]
MVVAGCGSEKAAGPQEGGAPGDAQTLIAAAVPAGTSYTAEVESMVVLPGRTTEQIVRKVQVGAGERPAYRVVSKGGEVRSVDGRTYEKRAGKGWRRVKLSAEQAHVEPTVGEQLADAHGLTSTATQMNGANATKIVGLLPLRAFFPKGSPQAKAAVTLAGQGWADLPFTLWLDDAGHPRLLTFRSDPAAPYVIQKTATYTIPAGPLTIKAPLH